MPYIRNLWAANLSFGLLGDYKTTSTYPLLVSVDLESGTCLAGWFWLRVTHEVAVKMETEAMGKEGGREGSIPSMQKAGISRDPQ